MVCRVTFVCEGLDSADNNHEQTDTVLTIAQEDVMSCCAAFCTMSPRQTTGVSAAVVAEGADASPVGGGGRGRRKPIDMHGRPWFTSGTIAPAVRRCDSDTELASPVTAFRMKSV